MFKQVFETSITPHITVAEVQGNLVVRGSEERRIRLHLTGGAGDAAVEREGEAFTLTAQADCTITCPPGTTLAVELVQGNLKVENVQGPVRVGVAQGNLTLRSVGPTELEQVFGNLDARQVAGELRVQIVRGNAQVHQGAEPLGMDQVNGNLVAAGLRGGLRAEKVGGNARLGPPFVAGQAYRLSSNGNLALRIPADASLRVALRASGGVRSHVPGLALEEREGELTGILGSGDASLEAQASGRISLWPGEEERVEEPSLAWVAEVEGLGVQIEARIAEAMAEMEARLEESLGRVDSEEIRRQMGRARQAAERDAERARMRAERAERRWQRASGRRPRARQERPTDEERMRVLRMVEEGKITPQQGADLLAALEGR